MSARWIAVGVLMTALALLVGCDRVIEAPDTATPYTLEIPMGFPQPLLPADNPLTEEGILLGRMLFYDPILSADSSQSCASCHSQEFAFTDSGKKFSVGVDSLEGKRNAMPVFNMAWNKRFFWDGRAENLKVQSLLPIQDVLEMHETLPSVVAKLQKELRYEEAFKAAFGSKKVTSEKMSYALEQFMLTLVSGNSKFDQVMGGQATFTAAEQRGFVLFNGESNPNNPIKGADCFHCHGGTLFSNYAFSNNGLDSVSADIGYKKVTGSEIDHGKFKVPSLRNVAITFPYMHDGRFTTLQQVLGHYNGNVETGSPTLDPQMIGFVHGLSLSPQQISDLVAFLETLTDETFTTNPAYATPF